MDSESKEIYTMKLHDRIYTDEFLFEIMRVPGGWIYTRIGEDCETGKNYVKYSVFVPYHKES